MSLLRSLNFVPQRFLDRGGIWSDVGFRNISGSLHDSRVHERRKVQELLLTDRRPCPVKKRWWGLTWSKRTEERIKSRGIWGGKVTRQLNAEDEAGVEDNSKNSSLGDWIGGDDIRSETRNTRRTGRLPGSSPWNSPGQNTGVGKPFPSPGDLPDPGIQPGFPALQADSLPAKLPGKPN